MTKVQVTYKLSRPLTDADFNNIARIHSVYGILAARIQPALDELFVEYDASRLSPRDVRGALEQHGLPIAAGSSSSATPAAPAIQT
ncbi:MAG TPA: hypothetical protein VHZ07_08640 [Bryobacteraceae bacterium]|jgi:hypothetical protein|nr:hypothetical protein [Bryobacteraceae bacterium]